MVHKINLHCHSNYSDGYNSLEEMMLEHKKQNYSVFVVTDHTYPTMYGHRSLTLETYTKQKESIQQLMHTYDYPIIQGIELGLWYEEVLLFGNEVILKVFECINKHNNEIIDNIVLIHKILDILSENKDKCAVVLCHPRLSILDNKLDCEFLKQRRFYKKLFDVIDGYEHYNMGHNFFKRRDIPQQLKTKKSFKNSDAHAVNYIHLGDNQTEYIVTNEHELINYIKQKMTKEYFLDNYIIEVDNNARDIINFYERKLNIRLQSLDGAIIKGFYYVQDNELISTTVIHDRLKNRKSISFFHALTLSDDIIY